MNTVYSLWKHKQKPFRVYTEYNIPLSTVTIQTDEKNNVNKHKFANKIQKQLIENQIQ